MGTGEKESSPIRTPCATPTAAPALTSSTGVAPGCAACLALAPCLSPWADPHHAAPRCAVLQEMTCRGCERSVITYSSLISACEKAGQWELALEFFQEMVGPAFFVCVLVLDNKHWCVCIGCRGGEMGSALAFAHTRSGRLQHASQRRQRRAREVMQLGRCGVG